MKRQITLVSAALLALTFSCSKKTAEAPPAEPAVPVVATPEPAPVTMATGPSEAELRRQRMQERMASVLKPVYFEYDQVALNEEAKSTLAQIGDIMKEFPEINNINVQGHADERGTEEYNFALGEKRATAIKNYLKDYGIPSDRLITISFGEEKPAIDAQGEEAWSKNRRGEFDVKE